jgi:Rab GTPase-activating protein 1
VVKQVQSDILPPLFIERCFGVLLSPGRLVRQADMQLLDMATMGYVKTTAEGSTSSASPQPVVVLTPQHQATTHAAYQIRAEWKASEKAFGQLNLESQKMFLTVAVDLVIKGIQEPVRFVIETQVTILSQNELRIIDNLFLHKRPMMLKFYLQLKEVSDFFFFWKLDSKLNKPRLPWLMEEPSLVELLKDSLRIISGT